MLKIDMYVSMYIMDVNTKNDNISMYNTILIKNIGNDSTDVCSAVASRPKSSYDQIAVSTITMIMMS